MKKLFLLATIFYLPAHGFDWRSLCGLSRSPSIENDPLVEAVRKSEYEKFPECFGPYGIKQFFKMDNKTGETTYYHTLDNNVSNDLLYEFKQKIEVGRNLQLNDIREKVRAQSTGKCLAFGLAAMGCGGFLYLLAKGVTPDGVREINQIVHSPGVPTFAQAGIVTALNLAFSNKYSFLAATSIAGHGFVKCVKGTVNNFPGKSILSIKKQKEYDEEITLQSLIKNMNHEEYKLLQKTNTEIESSDFVVDYNKTRDKRNQITSDFVVYYNKNRDILNPKRNAFLLERNAYGLVANEIEFRDLIE